MMSKKRQRDEHKVEINLRSKEYYRKHKETIIKNNVGRAKYIKERLKFDAVKNSFQRCQICDRVLMKIEKLNGICNSCKALEEIEDIKEKDGENMGGQASHRRQIREAQYKKNANKWDVCPECHRKGMNVFIRKTYSKGRTWRKLQGIRYCQWCGILFEVEENVLMEETVKMEGYNWGRNNVNTGGAGGIGLHIPYKEDIAEKIRSLKTVEKTPSLGEEEKEPKEKKERRKQYKRNWLREKAKEIEEKERRKENGKEEVK